MADPPPKLDELENTRDRRQATQVVDVDPRNKRTRGVLTIAQGVEAGRVLSLATGSLTTLGRVPECTFAFDDRQVTLTPSADVTAASMRRTSRASAMQAASTALHLPAETTSALVLSALSAASEAWQAMAVRATIPARKERRRVMVRLRR